MATPQQQQQQSYVYIKNTIDGKRFKFVSKSEIRSLTGARIDQFLVAGAGIRFPYRVTYHGRVVQPTDVLRDLGVEVGSTLFLEAAQPLPPAAPAENQQQQQQEPLPEQVQQPQIVLGADNNSATTPHGSKPSTASGAGSRPISVPIPHGSGGGVSPTSASSGSEFTTTWILIKNASDDKKYKFVSRGNVQDLDGFKVKQFLNVAAGVAEDAQTVSFNGRVIHDNEVLRDAGVQVGSTLVVTTASGTSSTVFPPEQQQTASAQQQFQNMISNAAHHDNNDDTLRSTRSGGPTATTSTDHVLHATPNTNIRQIEGSPSQHALLSGSPSSTSISPSSPNAKKTSLFIKNRESAKIYKFTSTRDVYQLTGMKVKHFVHLAAQIPVEDQTIRFRGLVVGDDEALADSGISPGDTLNLEVGKFVPKQFWYGRSNETQARDSNQVADEFMANTVRKQKQGIFEESCRELQAKVIHEYLPLAGDARDPLLKFRSSVSATVALETVTHLPTSSDDEGDDDPQNSKQQQQGQLLPLHEQQLQHLLRAAAVAEDPGAAAAEIMIEEHNDENEQQEQKQQQHQSEEDEQRARIEQRLTKKHSKQINTFIEFEARRRIELTSGHYITALLRIISSFEDDVRGEIMAAEDKWFQRNIVSEDAITMARLHTRSRVQRRLDAKQRLDAAVEKAQQQLNEEYLAALEEARTSDFAVRFRRACNKAHEFLRDETHLLFETGKVNALLYFGLETSSRGQQRQKQQPLDDVGVGVESECDEESVAQRAEQSAVELATRS